MSGLPILTALLALWLLACAVVLAWAAPRLRRLWREPVFAHPVLTIESDDWGAGPPQQAEALDAVADTLARHRDADGRPAAFNLALVLAVADPPAIRASGRYQRQALDAPGQRPVLEALRRGEARGVFELQLHGHEHYAPPVLMASADPAVQRWLRQDGVPVTEDLPSPLQSRWTDANTLPSRPLDEALVRRLVAEEVAEWRRLFGRGPAVVVPPTFVWTRTVEDAWAAEGIGCVVTPGWRYTRRGADGVPDGDEGPIVNGDRRAALVHLARCDYFEPARGRDAAYALAALARATAQGRPCVLENHRDNFLGDEARRRAAVAQLDRLLHDARAALPDLRFVRSAQLAAILRDGDPAWLVGDWRARLPRWWVRVQATGRAWRLLRLTGLAALGGGLVRLLARPCTPRAA